MQINTTYVENNLDTLQRMPESFVDMVITSPPYGNLRLYGGKSVWDFEIFQKFTKLLYRVLKPGAVVVWVVGDSVEDGSETGRSFKQALHFRRLGYNLHDTMIFAKKNYVPQSYNRYEQQFEYMFVFSKGRPKTFNPIMIPCKDVGYQRRRFFSKAKESSYAVRGRDEITPVKEMKPCGNVFFYGVGVNKKGNHNAPFPEQLVEDQVTTWSNEGDLIYDPFMGSGTTARICQKLNRNYIGSEINPDYVDY